jgi:hypothetical protein
MTLDTKSPFGILTGERDVTIEDPIFATLSAKLLAARSAGRSAKAALYSERLLAARHARKIRPGQQLAIDKPNTPDAVAPARFSPRIRWYPEKDRLRVAVDVVDSNYASANDDEKRRYRACLDIYVCPSGADADIYRVHLLEGEKNGEAYVQASQGGTWNQRGEPAPVKASWKRTRDGYAGEVKIPWSVLRGYRKGWKALPVEAQVLSKAREWSYFVMTASGDPDKSARTYSLLTPR